MINKNCEIQNRWNYNSKPRDENYEMKITREYSTSEST